VPAGFCNLVGLKPTPGLVSTAGVFPACRSLDCVSIFAHTVADGWTVLSTLAGTDPADAYTHRIPPLAPVMRKVRIGLPVPLDFLGDAAAEQAFARALELLRREPAFDFVDIAFEPFRDIARLLYEGPWIAERRLALGRFYDDHASQMDPAVRTIIGQADGKSAVDAFDAMYRLEAGKRMSERTFDDIDIMVVPTSPTIHRRSTIATDPIALNRNLGAYTNFVNLLDYAALSVPSSLRADGLPFGITLIGACGSDWALAELGQRYHQATGLTLGATGEPLPPAEALVSAPLDAREPRVQVAVVGAHLSGMPLNWQLTERGARLLHTAQTAPDYRLYALAGTVPPKPGLLRVAAGTGTPIEVEVWSMPVSAYGSFVAQIAAPLGIGTVQLAGERQVQGFLCEAQALLQAQDISAYGGWRGYLQAHAGADHRRTTPA